MNGAPTDIVIEPLAYDDGRAGCEATVNHPKPLSSAGPLTYRTGDSGVTTFTLDTSSLTKCGRWQADAFFDERRQAFFGVVIDSGKNCEPVVPPTVPPPPPPPVDICPNLEGNQPTVPAGLVKREGACVPPPPPPSCEQLQPPSASVSGFPVDTLEGGQWMLSGDTTVNNAGTWTIRILATSTLAEYTANTPDHVKVTTTVLLPCGESASRHLTYQWDGHSAEYWWMDVWRDGVLIDTTPVATNAHN